MVYTCKIMGKPLVSIALATYNGEAYLRQQLDSLLDQTYPHFEVVITDDGSTDGTLVILEEYADKDSRIRYGKSKLPRGFINNFTGAIAECKGEILFLCDQDDIWYKEKLASHVTCYDNPRIKWAYNKVRLMDSEENPMGTMTDTWPAYYSKSRRWILNYVWGSCILGCTTSYRTSAIRKFMPPDEEAAAHDSWLQMALWPSEPAAIDEVLQDYRVHGSNTSDFKLTRSKEEEKALETRAIKDNLVRLKAFSHNPRLQMWKRGIFFAALLGKHGRLAYRRLQRIIIS
jgi:glycosyltransferase involved in cell wall biosynthesis